MANRVKSALLAVGLMGFLWTACNSADADATSSQPGGGCETAVAVGFDSSGNPLGVVANNGSAIDVTPGHVAEWTVLNDGSEHSERTSPWVTPDQAPLLSDGSPYMGARSDPGLIWTGWPNQFAYVMLAESEASFQGTDGPAWPPDNPIDIVVAVSNDGGQTFGPASGPANGCTAPACFAVVSTPQSSAIDTTNGTVDQPVIVAEQPSTHVAWVTWDNINVPFNGGSKRPWIRRLHFNQDGTIDMGPVTEVRIDCNLVCTKFDYQNLAAYCDPSHTGDDCKNAAGQQGTETELIVFPRVNNSPIGHDSLTDNQASVGCSGTLDVQWRAAISQDGGNTWTQGVGNSDGSTIIGEDPVWPNCIVPGATAVDGNNRGRMAVVHDDETLLWHVYWTREMFQGNDHAPVGQRVFHSELNDQFFNTAAEEIAPVSTLPNASGPCDPTGAHECFVDQFMPTAAWSAVPGSSVHAVFWHDTRFDPNTPQGVIWGAFSHSSGNIGTFSNVEVDQAGAPWPFTGDNGNTPWGDYEGMAADDSGDFVPAWGDNRLQGSESLNTHVWWRVWGP